jgi:polar amino acid transport system ATP-binding protein
MINLEGIYKSFGSEQVLDNVNLEIDVNEVTAIIGPSGSGKSTLLRCINNLERIDNGSILVFDRHLVNKGVYSSQKEQKLVELDMTMIFQSFNLFPHLSVLDNIVLPQKLVLKKSKDEAKNIANSLLEQFNLLDLKDKYPSQLSGGQKQRVAITRGMAIDPKIMLFDEPTSALDPELVSEVLEAIKSLKEKGIGIILVTHEMEFVRDVADRVIFMDEGKVIVDGSVNDVFIDSDNERLKRFIGR